jgi:hypothetical protein
MNACGDEPATLHLLECPADPKEAKPKAAQTAAAIDRRLEMAGTDGSMPRRRTPSQSKSAAKSRDRESGSSLVRVWFGSAANTPTKINRGDWDGVNDTWASAARTRTELSGRRKAAKGEIP